MITAPDFKKLLHEELKTGIENPTREIFTIYNFGSVAPGATAIILEYQTMARSGALTQFILNFSTFTPPLGTYDLALQLDGSIIPQSQTGELFNYSDFINIPVNYSRYFDKSGQHIFSLRITNNGLVAINPEIYLKGFYINNE